MMSDSDEKNVRKKESFRIDFFSLKIRRVEMNRTCVCIGVLKSWRTFSKIDALKLKFEKIFFRNSFFAAIFKIFVNEKQRKKGILIILMKRSKNL